MYKAQSLEDTQMIGILLVLLKQGPIPTTVLSGMLAKGSGTTINKLGKLIDQGLVKDRREDAFPRRRILELTDRGRRVAEHLKAIDDILNED